jgi:peptidoglycan/xylan/chitin deacetylase (PgdA/CDA1 family)
LYDSITIDNRVFDLHTPRQRVQARRALGALARASGSPINFSRELARVYPFSQSTKAFYEGMTYNQLDTAGESDFIEIGAHTLTHPFLSQQTKSAQAIELIKSKQILTELTSNTVRYFAYPSGDYNHDTLELVKTAGYEAGFAVNPKNLGTDPRFEIDRTGIYSTSLLKLHMKALGVTRFARRFGFQVG